MNKQQLLQYFSGLDVATLQRLEKYSKLLIVPDEDLLTNVNMVQMVDKAHNLADSLFPEWTDRSKSDFGEFLVELFALFSEKDFWYLNAFANEGVFRKMKSYSNAFSKASSLGYSPITCKASSGPFSVEFTAGEEVTYERGDLILDVGGFKFSNDTPIQLESSTSPLTKQVTLYEGTQVVEDVTYNGYRIFIRKTNIDIDSISVTIDNVTYTRVSNFGMSAKDSTHFMVLPEEDGSCSVFFGSNGFGVSPSIGKIIHVEYRRCSGLPQIVRKQLPTIVDSLSLRKASSATMLNDSSYGRSPESLTSIKEKAPLFFNNKRVAINESTSEELLNGFPFVHKSKVVVIGREVVYRIIPSSGYLEPTSEELNTLSKEFNPYIIAGYQGRYSSNTYKGLLTSASTIATKLLVDAIVSPGYDRTSVEASLRQIMEDVTNPLVRAEYGGSFSKSQTDLLMRSSVPGVQSVSFRMLVNGNEQILPDVTLLETEIFRKISQTDLIVRINVI